MKIFRLKTLLAVILTVGLVGCSINQHDIDTATSACKNNGGLENMRVAELGITLVIVCKNGAQFLEDAN